jgi:hypothetical protein
MPWTRALAQAGYRPGPMTLRTNSEETPGPAGSKRDHEADILIWSAPAIIRTAGSPQVEPYPVAFMEPTSEDPATSAPPCWPALTDGFEAAKTEFDNPAPLTFDWCIGLGGRRPLELACGSPWGGRVLPRNRSDYPGVALPLCGETSTPCVQTTLRLPPDFVHLLWQSLLSCCRR